MQGLTPLHVAALHGDRQYGITLERMGCTPTELLQIGVRPQPKGVQHSGSDVATHTVVLQYGGQQVAGMDPAVSRRV